MGHGCWRIPIASGSGSWLWEEEMWGEEEEEEEERKSGYSVG